MLKQLLESILKNRMNEAKKRAYDAAIAIIDLNIGAGFPELDRHIFKHEMLVLPDGNALLLVPEHLGIPPIPIESSVISLIYEASQSAITNKDNYLSERPRSAGLKEELAKANGVFNRCPLPADDEVFMFTGILSKNEHGHYATIGKTFINRNEYDVMDDIQEVSFTTDLNTPVPEGKMPVYCVYDKRISAGGVLIKDPFSRESSEAEIADDSKILGHTECILSVGFIDKK